MYFPYFYLYIWKKNHPFRLGVSHESLAFTNVYVMHSAVSTVFSVFGVIEILLRLPNPCIDPYEFFYLNISDLDIMFSTA